MREPQEITPEIAELAGLFAADGNLQKEHISLWGNIYEDQEHYDNVLAPLFKHAFNFIARPHEKKSNSVYGFNVCTPSIIKYFHEKLEFPYGSKTYTVQVPQIIMNSTDPEVWAAFIRGYTDGDGSFSCFRRQANSKYRKIRRVLHMEPRIKLSSVSFDLIEQVSELMCRMNIPHYTAIERKKKKNEADSMCLFVNGKKRLSLWMKSIGFSNPAKLSRVAIYALWGFVPPKTTHEQRKLILKGDLHPLALYTNL